MKKKIAIIAIIVVFISSVVWSVIFFTKSDDDWTPAIQGSQVIELEYEELDDGYHVEMYTDFSSFKKSAIAKYNFISQKQAYEERYSKTFFDTKNLMVIKFNRKEKSLDFTVADVKTEGNDCIVNLVLLKSLSEISQTETTYGCFIETERDFSDYSVKVTVAEIEHDSQEFPYITLDNKYYEFKGEELPTVYKITNKQGIADYFEHDTVLGTWSYIYKTLDMYSEETFVNSSLILIRIPSSDFEKCGAYIDGEDINIVGTKSNHYYIEKETKYHKLIAVLVPKDWECNHINREIYSEYEDNLIEKYQRSEYTISSATDLSDKLICYKYENVG